MTIYDYKRTAWDRRHNPTPPDDSGEWKLIHITVTENKLLWIGIWERVRIKPLFPPSG